jgi:hypothetical protein
MITKRLPTSFLIYFLLVCLSCLKIQYQFMNSKLIDINSNLVQVKKGCLILFSDCDFKGEKKVICQSESDLRKVYFDKKVSSILVGEKTLTILRTGYNFKGIGVLIDKNVRCFDKAYSKYQKNISSLIIKPNKG